MKLPVALAAAFAGVVGFAAPALAIEQIHIPDASAAQNSAPPDALFDKSIPTTWQKKADEKQSGGSNFHFTVQSGSDQVQPRQNFGNTANQPGSEFHQNGVVVGDPYNPQ